MSVRERNKKRTKTKNVHSAAVVAPRAQAAGSREIASGPTATPFDDFKFLPIRESTVSRAMTSRYFKVRGTEEREREMLRKN